MKKILIILIAVLCFLTCAGCESKITDEPVSTVNELVVWHTMDESYTDKLKQIADSYYLKSGVKIVWERQEDWNTITNNLLTTSISGDMPDIAMTNTKFIAGIAANDIFTDLNPLFESSDVDKGNFNESMLTLCESEDGQLIGLPWQNNTHVIYYNKTVLEKVGLSIPEKFSDWGKFLNDLKEATGITPISMQGLDFYYGSFFRNEGVNIVKDGDCDLGSEKSIKVASTLGEYVKKGLINWYTGSTASADMKSDFIDEKCIMVFHNSSALQNYVSKCSFEVGLALYPAGSMGNNYDMGGAVIGICNSIGEENKVAAFDFLMYMYSDDVYADLCYTTGTLPATKTAVTSDEIHKLVSAYPEYEKLYIGLEKLTSPFVNGNAQAICKTWQSYMNQIASGELDAKSAMTKCQAEIESIIR